jgi:hypothetical protein
MAQTKRHTEHAWSFFTAAARQAARERQVINLRPHFAYQNGIRSQKPFRMTSLREIDLQPSWNDILTKNIGGGGMYHFLTTQFSPPPTSRLEPNPRRAVLRAIDIHAHYYPESYLNVLGEIGKRFGGDYHMTETGPHVTTPRAGGAGQLARKFTASAARNKEPGKRAEHLPAPVHVRHDLALQAHPGIRDRRSAERVMIGSDYCFDMGITQPVQVVEELNLSASQR